MKRVFAQAIDPAIRIVNYFDVPAGNFWGPRQIPDYELIFIVKGVFRYEQKGISQQTADNQILCIPPHVQHTLRHIKKKATISCIHFDLLKNVAANPNVYCPEPQPAIITKPKNPVFFHHLFREIYLSFESTRPEEHYIMHTLFKCLWAKLSLYWHGSQQQKISRKVKAITQFLKENIYQKLDRHVLAEQFGYTPEHINYLFKKELGMTPTQFVNHEKILLAFDMLSNRKMTIKEVSQKLNFYDRYHFSKMFKKIIGRPPSHCMDAPGRNP